MAKFKRLHLSVFIIVMAALNYCFLRSNKEIRPRNHSIVSTHVRNNTSTIKQKVVLLAGPHKTASTSIQANLFLWANDPNHSSGLSKSWSLPTPFEKLIGHGCVVKNTFELRRRSHVYWAISAIRGKEKIKCMVGPNGDIRYSFDEFLQFYKEEYYEQWIKGKNLAIASEEMDEVGNVIKGKEILQHILELLPWNSDILPPVSGSNEDITVVVVYRSPRSIHLQSLWHQCCMQNEPFEEYLATVNSRTWFPFHYLDSLNLAHKFIQEGLKTIIIDTAGVSNKGYDISNVVACDILGANCTPQKRFFGQSDEQPSKANVKNATHSVTQEQMKMIDEAFENYECKFLSFEDHPNLIILYQDSLSRVFSKCRERPVNSSTILDKKGLLDMIVQIAKNV